MPHVVPAWIVVGPPARPGGAARFREGMPREEAHDLWTDVHAPMGVALPDMYRYVQSHVVGAIGTDGVTDGHVGFRGFSECWYADEAAYVRSQESEAWGELYQDGFNFLDVEGLEGMSAILEERVIKA